MRLVWKGDWMLFQHFKLQSFRTTPSVFTPIQAAQSSKHHQHLPPSAWKVASPRADTGPELVPWGLSGWPVRTSKRNMKWHVTCHVYIYINVYIHYIIHTYIYNIKIYYRCVYQTYHGMWFCAPSFRLLAIPQVREGKLGKCRDKKEPPCGYHLPITVWSNPVVIFCLGQVTTNIGCLPCNSKGQGVYDRIAGMESQDL